MNILLLRGFNNYFNRKVKLYTALSDYRSNAASYIDLTNINFNPNDGVATELILGGPTQLENNNQFIWDINGTPDYLVVNAGGYVQSRWFVLESERTRSGQYRLALKRDVIAENYSQIMSAPCFVEKGSITDTSNPLLYNSESLTYNQIKQSEQTLRDSTNSAWIIGYMAKNRANQAVSVSTSLAITDGLPIDYYDEEDLPFSVSTTGATLVYNYINDTLTTATAATHVESGSWGNYYIEQGWKLNNFNTNALKVADNSNAASSFARTGYIIPKSGSYAPTTSAQLYTYLATQGYGSFKVGTAIPFYDNNGNALFTATAVTGDNATKVNLVDKYAFWGAWGGEGPDYPSAIQKDAALYNAVTPTISATLKSRLNTLMSGYVTATASDILSTYNGKYVKVNGNYYRISISAASGDRYDVFTASTYPAYTPTFAAQGDNVLYAHTDSTIDAQVPTIVTSQGGDLANATNTSYNTGNLNGSFVIAKSKGYNVVLSQISVETIDATLGTSKRATYDSPANLFAIPYGNVKFKTSADGETFTTQPDEGLALARAIAQELGSSVCYDIQLLPYVPSQTIRTLMADDDTLTLTDLESANYDVATRTFSGTTSTATFIIYPSSCKGTFDIACEINGYQANGVSAALGAKITNETQLCRLVSPNFNGMFEFSLAKNGGVSKFNVDYTYKPIQPYIHVNPDFKFIYGQDWDDARGLICGGDFSLSFINDAWVNYENSNKNYQAIFNRQIDNMDVNNRITYEQQLFSTQMGIITGSIGGAAGGALAGSKAGPYGAAIGAAVGLAGGTVMSALGGMKDMDWLRRAQAEAKDYAKDMYGYQLGNIKALPYSLSRSESLTNNNKLFPIVELYAPTNLEIDNLINKLNYNGMTIMAIGKLSDYATSGDFPWVYLQGQMIRLDGITDDFHVADAIYQEVSKGFYIQQEGEE